MNSSLVETWKTQLRAPQNLPNYYTLNHSTSMALLACYVKVYVNAIVFAMSVICCQAVVSVVSHSGCNEGIRQNHLEAPWCFVTLKSPALEHNTRFLYSTDV